jgi:hypothetical protein
LYNVFFIYGLFNNSDSKRNNTVLNAELCQNMEFGNVTILDEALGCVDQLKPGDQDKTLSWTHQQGQGFQSVSQPWYRVTSVIKMVHR